MLGYEINPNTGNKQYSITSTENMRLIISVLKSLMKPQEFMTIQELNDKWGDITVLPYNE